MLLFLAAMCLWVPALAGWALPWALLRGRLGGPGLRHLDGGDGVAALAALTALAVLLNFIVPINSLVSGLALLAGWLLGAVRLFLVRPWAVPLRAGLLALPVIILAALLANAPPDSFDSGLYHYQGIAWARQFALPLGLANLHGRFGFNSSTTPLAAITHLPLWDSTASANLYLLGGLCLGIYGAELVSAWRRPGPRVRRSTIFLALGAAVLCSARLWSRDLTLSINSPTSDWPVLVLTLLAVAIALRAFDEPTTLTETIASTTLIALFAATVKLSAVALVGLPVALMLYAHRQRWRLPWRLLARLVATVGLGLGLPWLIRSVQLSGCLAYPIAATCFSTLPWAAPTAGVMGEANWVISWARMPGPNLAITLQGWGWLPSWLEATRHDRAVLGTLTLLLLGVVVWIAAGGPRATAEERRPALVIGAPVGAGLAYWFLTAPDVRFAAGLIWSVGLLAASLGYHQLARSPRRDRALLVQRASLALGGLMILGLAVLLGLHSAAYWVQAGPTGYLLKWPPVAQVETVVMTTTWGDAVQVPADGDQCWLAPLPCTPYFYGALQIDYDDSGAPRQFSFAAPP